MRRTNISNHRYKKSNNYKYLIIFLILFLTYFFIKNISKSKAIKGSQITENLERERYENLLVKSISNLEYTDDFKHNDEKPSFFFSDTEGSKVFVISMNGKILYEIGSGVKGSRDGNFNNAEFCSPAGLVYGNNKLYIADTCNNAVREVDFENQMVSTLVESSEKLSNPIGVEFFGKDKLAISCNNKNGLSFYNLRQDALKNILDASSEVRNIAKVLKYDTKLYFLDKTKNGIFALDENNEVEEILNIDSSKIQASSFHIDDTGIYVIDSKNSKIFKSDKENKKLNLYLGKNITGNKLGKIAETELNNPLDILAVKDRLYVSDSKNFRIVEVDKNKDKTIALRIYPDVFSKGLNELGGYLNNSEFQDELKFAYNKKGEIVLNIREDYKFTNNAPNNLYIFERDDKNVVLIKNYSSDDIKTGKLTLPKFKKGKVYYIRGTFYYCEKSENSPCMVKNYNKKLIATEEKVSNFLQIEF